MLNSEYRIEDPKRPYQKIVYLVLGLVVVVGLVMFVYFFTKINRAASSVSVPVDVTIEKGSTSKDIAEMLDEKKVISSKFAFLVYVKTSGAANKIQAGDYSLDGKMSMSEIVEILTKGKVTREDKKVTVIEGWTSAQIAKNLEQRNIFSSAQFNIALASNDFDFKFLETAKKFGFQGFLFPDTYVLDKNADAKVLVGKMLDNFESKITTQMLADMQAKNLTMEEVLTVASIVEKEVGRNKEKITEDDEKKMQEERKLVASVFYNRLEIDMPLQSDATVNFITGKGDRQALFSDIEIKSPYNTYQVVGLPPTPICNPGIDSIMAAIYPAESDYLYFLNKTEGEAVFGKTIEEHNENRRLYLD